VVRSMSALGGKRTSVKCVRVSQQTEIRWRHAHLTTRRNEPNASASSAPEPKKRQSATRKGPPSGERPKPAKRLRPTLPKENKIAEAHAKVAVYHGTVLAKQRALCPTSSYAVERRDCKWPCKILASAASLAAFRHLAWRRLLAFFFAFPARAAILTLLFGLTAELD